MQSFLSANPLEITCFITAVDSRSNREVFAAPFSREEFIFYVTKRCLSSTEGSRFNPYLGHVIFYETLSHLEIVSLKLLVILVNKSTKAVQHVCVCTVLLFI